MTEREKCELAREGLAHARDIIQKLFGKDYEWKNEDIKRMFYTLNEMCIWFAEMKVEDESDSE